MLMNALVRSISAADKRKGTADRQIGIGLEYFPFANRL